MGSHALVWRLVLATRLRLVWSLTIAISVTIVGRLVIAGSFCNCVECYSCVVALESCNDLESVIHHYDWNFGELCTFCETES